MILLDGTSNHLGVVRFLRDGGGVFVSALVLSWPFCCRLSSCTETRRLQHAKKQGKVSEMLPSFRSRHVPSACIPLAFQFEKKLGDGDENLVTNI